MKNSLSGGRIQRMDLRRGVLCAIVFGRTNYLTACSLFAAMTIASTPTIAQWFESRRFESQRFGSQIVERFEIDQIWTDCFCPCPPPSEDDPFRGGGWSDGGWSSVRWSSEGPGGGGPGGAGPGGGGWSGGGWGGGCNPPGTLPSPGPPPGGMSGANFAPGNVPGPGGPPGAMSGAGFGPPGNGSGPAYGPSEAMSRPAPRRVGYSGRLPEIPESRSPDLPKRSNVKSNQNQRSSSPTNRPYDQIEKPKNLEMQNHKTTQPEGGQGPSR